MIEELKSWLTDGRKEAGSGLDETRTAVAALLFEAAQAEGESEGSVDPEEQALIARLLAAHFALPPEKTREVAAAGREAMSGSVQLFGFAQMINSRFPFRSESRLWKCYGKWCSPTARSPPWRIRSCAGSAV
jgi:uncharacterized tellurite resistance protein B-like protein